MRTIVKKHYMSAEQYKTVLIYTHICRAYTKTSSFIIFFKTSSQQARKASHPQLDSHSLDSRCKQAPLNILGTTDCASVLLPALLRKPVLDKPSTSWLTKNCSFDIIIIIREDQLHSQVLQYSNWAFHQPLTTKRNSSCCWNFQLWGWGVFCHFSGCLGRVVVLSRKHRQPMEAEIIHFTF